MQSLSLLTVPEYNQRIWKRRCIGVSIDWKRFNIRRRSVIERLWYLSKHASNETNNSTYFMEWLTFQRIRSPHWIAHNVSFAFEWDDGIPISVPVVHIEVAGKWQGLKESVGRVDFYGAYFQFRHLVPNILKWMYETLESLSKEGVDVNCTRVDVCVDIQTKFPQGGYNLITPSKNTKRKVQSFRDPKTNKWEGFSFDAKKNSAYGIRIYDKAIDIKDQGKEFWYKWYPETWTRVEFEFYNPYASMDESTLVKNVTKRVLGEGISWFDLKYRPTSWLTPQTAYNWFKSYAKKHGIEIQSLIDVIQKEHIRVISLLSSKD